MIYVLFGFKSFVDYSKRKSCLYLQSRNYFYRGADQMLIWLSLALKYIYYLHGKGKTLFGLADSDSLTGSGRRKPTFGQ